MHIGLIGGIGPAATVFYYGRIVALIMSSATLSESAPPKVAIRELPRHS